VPPRDATNAFESLIGFVEGNLKLKVNRAKSAGGRPWERKFLGFSFTPGRGAKRRLAPTALAKAKRQIRQLPKEGRRNFQAIMAELRRYLSGWRGYLQFCLMTSALKTLEESTRRRLCRSIWRQRKRGRIRFAEPVKRGAEGAGHFEGFLRGRRISA